ncbi:hypothetical protein [Streptomyces sp. NPDC048636]|uniref:hypothetical protein n=1 Tax=Streptomyces sp. NPDC048636 TaxID=3155762 RepID=UPI003442F314
MSRVTAKSLATWTQRLDRTTASEEEYLDTVLDFARWLAKSKGLRRDLAKHVHTWAASRSSHNA